MNHTCGNLLLMRYIMISIPVNGDINYTSYQLEATHLTKHDYLTPASKLIGPSLGRSDDGKS